MIRFWWITLLSASISGSIATAVLMLVCGLLRFFKKEQPLLFAGCLALALYLFPFALLFPQKGLSLPPVDPNLSSGVLPFVEPFSPALTESSLTFAFLSPAERILEMIPFVWLLIFLLLAFRSLCKNYRFARYLSRKRIPCRAGEAYTAQGKEIPVYQISMPCSPFAYGLFHPAIYLPDGHRLSKSALLLVLRHESTHIRQKHLWIKAAAQLAAMLHWFCPFVWLMKVYLEDACEIRCDHTVTAAMNGGERKRYAQLFFCLLVVTLPLQVLVFPLYQIFQRLGLLDTLWALILPGAFSPLGAILMWHAFSGIPAEQIQSAEELGANEAQILFRLALPLCKRDVLLLCLVTLAEQWNQLEFSMAFLQSKENYTLSGYLATNAVSDTVQLLADCLFSLLPLCIVFAAFL
ncbi:MAG: M56 family metallopeptidase, partial [Oscillospiraceae bacterium]|nr:M56 family metallopeptidase [Oscillospiraceae bacterium]